MTVNYEAIIPALTMAAILLLPIYFVFYRKKKPNKTDKNE